MRVEGRNAVAELIKTDVEIDKIMIEDGMRDAPSRALVNQIKSMGFKVQFAPKQALDKNSERGKHQGFIAFVPDFEYAELEDIIYSAQNKDGLIIALDGINDPHNLGAIIRVCECAGADGLIITRDRCCQVTDTVMRISEGGAAHLKIARVINLVMALEKLKEKGYWVTGADLGGENLYKADLTGKTVIVIGGEDSGIRKLTKQTCDRIVQIPMCGKVNSLNASVACGIVVFEALRQRT